MKSKIYELVSSAKKSLFALTLTVFLGTAYSQTTYTFNSTGSIQNLSVMGGDYKIECWGGDGGTGTYYSAMSPNNNIDGGKGGYSVGFITVTTPTTWYVVVGGKGSNTLAGNNPGGYNGGGNSSSPAYQAGSGGGASHVATASGLLSSLVGNQSAVLIVAGGGGGGGNQSLGGDGGGLNGVQPPTSTQYLNRTAGGGGSQTAGGVCYTSGFGAAFGQGGTTSQNLAGGGGGGWYGGCSGDNSTAGGGGSGYIGGVSNGTTVTKVQPGFVPNPDVTGTGFVVITRLCDVNVSASKNPICAGELITLSTNAGTNIQWNTGATTPSISVSPSSTTSYTVSGVSTSSTACSSTVSILVTVNPLPAIALESFPSVFCAAAAGSVFATGAQSYTWSNGANGASTLVSPTVTSVYTATGTSVHGCKNTATVTVNVNTNSLTITQNTTICKGATINLSAGGVSNVMWSNGSSFLTIPVSPSVATTYSVSGQDALGCILTNSVLINVNNLPAVTVSASKQTICRGESVTLTASGATSFVWDNAETSASITKTLTVDVPYHFSVTGTDANGCSSFATITVNASACSGIQENEMNTISIFPNPATQQITVSTASPVSKVIAIADLTGRILLALKTDESTFRINIENLPSGLYHVRVKDGVSIKDQKFVKQ